MELSAVLEAVEGRGGAEAVERVLARYNEEVTGRWGGGRASSPSPRRASRPLHRCRRPTPPRPGQHRAAGVPPPLRPLSPGLGPAVTASAALPSQRRRSGLTGAARPPPLRFPVRCAPRPRAVPCGLGGREGSA